MKKSIPENHILSWYNFQWRYNDTTFSIHEANKTLLCLLFKKIDHQNKEKEKFLGNVCVYSISKIDTLRGGKITLQHLLVTYLVIITSGNIKVSASPQTSENVLFNQSVGESYISLATKPHLCFSFQGN